MNEAQIAFLVLYLIYIGIIVVFYNTLVMKPFRLLTTFLHEMSHAIACWMTCGSVQAIRVYENEGGVTSYYGGCRLLIIPAGYVGAAIWGCIFVMFSGGRKTATGAAGALLTMLLISLCFAPNRTMIGLNIFYAIATGIFIYLEWHVFTPILGFVVLFYGAFVGIGAVEDVYQDTVKRTVLRSDAYACYQICPCCLPRCVGLQWAAYTIVLQVAGAWIAMMQLSNRCENTGWWDCLSGDGESADKFWQWEQEAAQNIGNWVH
jgi:hypothetical protein